MYVYSSEKMQGCQQTCLQTENSLMRLQHQAQSLFKEDLIVGVEFWGQLSVQEA